MLNSRGEGFVSSTPYGALRYTEYFGLLCWISVVRRNYFSPDYGLLFMVTLSYYLILYQCESDST